MRTARPIRTTTELADAVRRLDGATVKAGSGVLEAFARHTDKGTALMALASDLGVVTTAFLGEIEDRGIGGTLYSGDYQIFGTRFMIDF